MWNNGKTIALVIPALNEESSIGTVLQSLPKWIDVVVVANNGSTDSTADVARDNGALVVDEPNRGYGAACLAALTELRKSPPDVVAFIDADFSDDPKDLVSIVRAVAEDETHLCIGSRTTAIADRGSLTPVQRLGNWLSTWLIKLLWNVQFSDLGPMRAITWHHLEQLRMADTTWGWTVEMQLKAAKQGLTCSEVPVRYRDRIGVSKISGTVMGSIKAGWKILFTIAKLSLTPITVTTSFLLVSAGAVVLSNSPDAVISESAIVFSIVGGAFWLVGTFALFKLTSMSRQLKLSLTVAALLAQFSLAPVIGIGTDDFLRYEWDGQLTLAQEPQRLLPPNSPQLAHHSTTSQINGKPLPDSLPFSSFETIYPPLAQHWFALQSASARVLAPTMGTVLAWKLPSLFAIYLALFGLIPLLGRAQLPNHFAFAVAFSPLLLIHAVADVHIDIVMILSIIVAILLLPHRISSTCFWAFSVLVKLAPLLAIPILLRRMTFRDALIFLATFIVVLVGGYVILSPSLSLGSLSSFAAKWQANAFVFTLVKYVTSDSIARAIVASVFTVLTCLVYWRQRDPIFAAGTTLLLLFILSPVVHPWYVLPLLFLIPFHRRPSAIVMCGTVLLSTVVYSEYKKSGMWVEHSALLTFEYLPVIFLLALEFLRKKRTSS